MVASQTLDVLLLCHFETYMRAEWCSLIIAVDRAVWRIILNHLVRLVDERQNRFRFVEGQNWSLAYLEMLLCQQRDGLLRDDSSHLMRTEHLNQPLIVGILTAEESEDTSPRSSSSSDSDYGVFITYGATGFFPEDLYWDPAFL